MYSPVVAGTCMCRLNESDKLPPFYSVFSPSQQKYFPLEGKVNPFKFCFEEDLLCMRDAMVN